MGSQSGTALTIGRFNTGIGVDALNAETVGDYSTAIGYRALWKQNSDSNNENTYNTGVGAGAGYYNVTGQYNTWLGVDAGAGELNYSNGNNTGVGALALTEITTGNNNVAVGAGAHRNATISANTVAIGYQAGYNSTASQDWVYIGYQAGYGGTGNHYSVYVGYQSGYGAGAGSGGERNSALGKGTLLNTNGGSDNCAIGYDSSKGITTGDFNTTIGAYSNPVLTTGSDNIYIGSYTKSSAVDITNEIVIGAGANDGSDYLVGKGNDTAVIGGENGYIWNDFSSNGTWQQVSDERTKKDIKDSDLGLSFINDLRPVTYKKKPKSEYPKSFDDYNEKKTTVKDKKLYGFIAQEVKEAMDKASHSDFTAWTEGKDGMQGLGVAELITPLVKAVQELSAEIDKLKEQLNKES